MGFVAARVTGETDVTPTKALGPVTQLLYGVITPGNLSGNIMCGERHRRHRPARGRPADHAQDRLAARREPARAVLRAALRRGRRRGGGRAGVQPPDPRSDGARHRRVAGAVVPGVGRRVEGVRRRHRRARRTGARRRSSSGCCWASRWRCWSASRRRRVVHLRAVAVGPRHRDGDPGQQRDRHVPRRAFGALARCAASARRRPSATWCPVASGLIAGESLMGVVIALLTVWGVLKR